MNTDCILYEDNDIIVCYKPAGIATQTSKVGSPDMVSEIKGYLAEKDKVKDKNSTNTARQSIKDPYVGLINRLDQPVEGILVFAKNKKSAAGLSEQVQDSRMKKYYLAIVRVLDSGILKEDSIDSKNVSWESIPENSMPEELELERTLTDYLYQDKSSNTSYVTKEEKPGAKLAKLSYQIVESQTPIALLRIHLLTGRHHQIRVQLTNAGYSLLGDYKYADEKTKALSGWLGQKQVALCAYELAFLHPVSGKQLNFRVQPKGEIFHKFKLIESI